MSKIKNKEDVDVVMGGIYTLYYDDEPVCEIDIFSDSISTTDASTFDFNGYYLEQVLGSLRMCVSEKYYNNLIKCMNEGQIFDGYKLEEILKSNDSKWDSYLDIMFETVCGTDTLNRRLEAYKNWLKEEKKRKEVEESDDDDDDDKAKRDKAKRDKAKRDKEYEEEEYKKHINNKW